MKDRILQIDPRDNAAIALTTLAADEIERMAGKDKILLRDEIPARHKFALRDLQPGDEVILYGAVVGEAVTLIPRGALLTTENIRHRAAEYGLPRHPVHCALPDPAPWKDRTFLGYHRADWQVGTRNYWLVLPLVFCENRNIERMREALEEELGYGPLHPPYRQLVRGILHAQSLHKDAPPFVADDLSGALLPMQQRRVFANLDGIRFLTHQAGCGGTRQDARALCGLLAGYLHHPNVAGATVLSLGCQNAQAEILFEELRERHPGFNKPVLVYDQQQLGGDEALMHAAIRGTLEALAQANAITRAPAPLSALTVGLKCGGSDGFSGLSANPALGHVSDLLSALGGRSILSEFPELHGVEQSLLNRCANDTLAERFQQLMQDYSARAIAVDSAFEMNPSPGNIADGLITGSMKSAGAARKSGTAPIQDVLDYPAYATTPGLNLLCTPGNDVECVTAQVGAGASLVLFTTGMGTPTGNPIAPVIKIATNTALAERMAEIIDFDAGSILTSETSIAEIGEEILDLSIAVASGQKFTKAELLGQYDFIPWKRGVSL